MTGLMNDYGKNRVPFIFIVSYDRSESLVSPVDELTSLPVLFDINGFSNITEPPTLPEKKISLRKFPVRFEQYLPVFDRVQKHLTYGNSYLLNLTFPTRVEINLTLDEIFHRSRAKYRLRFRNFVVFSPESFIQVRDNCLYSFPMKGTIHADSPGAEGKILEDLKESAEHATIVDLIRNDMSIWAKKVVVEKYRYVEKVRTHEKDILQVSSKIRGELDKNYHEKLGDIVYSLLPAGSISGAPKSKTIKIIREVENYQRGFYTGVFGYYDGQNLDSGVMIRYIEQTDDQFYYKSGGGITTQSDPYLEYQEMIDKIYVPVF